MCAFCNRPSSIIVADRASEQEALIAVRFAVSAKYRATRKRDPRVNDRRVLTGRRDIEMRQPGLSPRYIIVLARMRQVGDVIARGLIIGSLSVEIKCHGER